jgi:glycerol-3-phosphate dehydrogenase
MKPEVAIVGAGVVGSATALALARRGAQVVLLEAESEPGLCASGTNSGILHTGFDSVPGELETELILRAAVLRDPVLEALGVPHVPCGGLMLPRSPGEEVAIARLAENAARNGVEVELRDDGALVVPGESITDPMAYTQALAAAAELHGARLRTGFRARALERAGEGLAVLGPGDERVEARVVVNCAGLGADRVAGSAGQDTFEVYPRKGEFLVFEQSAERLERILLPVPEEGTKGVIVFPTVDGHVIAGPTAVDGTDKTDWSVRPEARDEILAKAAPMYEPLADAEPIAAYAGLRTAAREKATAGPGRPVNYLIGPSSTCEGLVNVAAIRSTGMTASLAIAERACELVAAAGMELGDEAPLERLPAAGPREPWWRRAADLPPRGGS